jgi:hypothetical protein
VRSRMGTRYEYLTEFARPVEPDAGGSGYFGAPAESLDPRLFIEGTEQLRPEIRIELLNVLEQFWATRYVDMDSWAHVWIAGSSITHQWAERTSKGDIDVLIGIDMPVFFERNQHLKAFPEKVVADHMNAEFREHLWPNMEDYFGGQFEVTYYFNPSTGTDIRRINPYAAYNLKTDQFDVRHVVPDDWGEHHIPPEWNRAVEAEIEQAQGLIDRYNRLAREVAAAPDGPRRVNLTAELGTVVEQVSAFYENIHAERRNAYQGRFGVPGAGFFDYYNFRWQAFKKSGVGPTLNSIRRTGRDVERAQAEARYGTPPSADVLTPSTLKDYF